MLNLKYAEESSIMRICVVFYTNFNVSGEPAASISGQKCSSFFLPEDEGSILLWYCRTCIQVYTTPLPKRQYSLITWKRCFSLDLYNNVLQQNWAWIIDNKRIFRELTLLLVERDKKFREFNQRQRTLWYTCRSFMDLWEVCVRSSTCNPRQVQWRGVIVIYYHCRSVLCVWRGRKWGGYGKNTHWGTSKLIHFN